MVLWLVILTVVAIALPLYVLFDVDHRCREAFELNYTRLMNVARAVDAQNADLRSEIRDLRAELSRSRGSDYDIPRRDTDSDLTDGQMEALLERLFPGR